MEPLTLLKIVDRCPRNLEIVNYGHCKIILERIQIKYVVSGTVVLNRELVIKIYIFISILFCF